MTVLDGRFTRSAMQAALDDVCHELDVSPDEAELLRLTNNAVFALPRADIVVRIARTGLLFDRVHKVVRLAKWFSDLDAPTIRLVDGVEQPLVAGDSLATVWTYVPPLEPKPTPTDLGPTLRRFHALGLPDFELPRWNPVADARQRIEDAEGLSAADHDFLIEQCDQIESQIVALSRDASSLVHGDAHAGNLLREADGRVVLCDFDATAIGPWQFDLVAVAVGERRFGRHGANDLLASSYGYDVTADPAWPLFRAARELKMVAAGAPLLKSGVGVAEEFDVRLRSIREGDESARWTPFADVAS